MNKYLCSILVFLSFSVCAESTKSGSGQFVLPGGEDRTEKTLSVYYHIPGGAHADSPVVLVIPGAGRNAWSYRDAWISSAEEKGIIVVSPSYSEEFYPRFWNYNIARMIDNVKINAAKTDFESYSIVDDPKEWIFNDFDRIFSEVQKRFELTTDEYDIFGHSAGGQILHRFAMFYDSEKVNRIVSANSGWYTVPDLDAEFPLGLVNAPIKDGAITKAFSKKLVVFLGEQDDENETRGHLVKNPRMNKQGLHRLARGEFFFSAAKKQAKHLQTEFNWERVIVPKVGHDYKKMSEAASEYLYSD